MRTAEWPRRLARNPIGSSPQLALPPVAHELTVEVEPVGHGEDVHAAVVARRALLLARAAARGGRPAPHLPAERHVERRACLGRAECAELVLVADDLLERAHDGGPVPA